MADEIPRTGRIPRRGVTARRRYPLSARKATTNSRTVVPATPSQLERALNRQESVPNPETPRRHVNEGIDRNVFAVSEESRVKMTFGKRTEESPIVLLRHMSRVSVKAQEHLQTPKKQLLSPVSKRSNFRTPGSATTTPTSARRILKFTPGIIASLTKKPVKSAEHRVRHGRVTKETPINILRRLTRVAGFPRLSDTTAARLKQVQEEYCLAVARASDSIENDNRLAAVGTSDFIEDDNCFIAVGTSDSMKDDNRLAAVGTSDFMKDDNRLAAVGTSDFIEDDNCFIAVGTSDFMKDDNRLAAVGTSDFIEDDN
ncbi:5811_t:CDS:2, partial [Paraglomus brasilianum]